MAHGESGADHPNIRHRKSSRHARPQAVRAARQHTGNHRVGRSHHLGMVCAHMLDLSHRPNVLYLASIERMAAARRMIDQKPHDYVLASYLAGLAVESILTGPRTAWWRRARC